MSNNDPVRVKDVMTDHYNLVDGLMMTDHALAKMKETGAHVLIVDKRDDNDEYGIVLLSDLSLIHISEPTRPNAPSRMPSSA